MLGYFLKQPRTGFFTLLLVFAALSANQASASSLQKTNTAPLKLGIDVLEENGFALLKGKRVGLLTHPAGVNRYGVSTLHILSTSKSVSLTALYGPEHGIYGDEEAGAHIENRRDSRTGLPIYSLYGKFRKPTPAMLQPIDTLVIDLQDIGVRSYTFVSCMKLALEACFENNVEVIILDRPNPLGGLKVDGPMIEKEWISYVGAFPTPYVHGLTIGELARMAVSRPGILELSDNQRKNGKLSVITMSGWKRYMSWPATGLKWTAASPNIPDFQSVAGYAMTGLGAQIGSFNHGIGTEYPFRILSCEGLDNRELIKKLQKRNIPGITIVPESYRNGNGAYVRITDWSKWRPTELSFHTVSYTHLTLPTNREV